jgi:hypothetical protein
VAPEESGAGYRKWARDVPTMRRLLDALVRLK